MKNVPRPYTLVAELTHRCPLSCLHCSNPRALVPKWREISTDDWLRVLDEAAIRELGEAFGRELGVPFFYQDFRAGWNEGVRISKEMEMYRQPYCGCVYSEKERYYK